MSIPKSKMISASKAIMAIAARAKYNTDDSVKAIQNQTVTVNVQQHPTVSPATVINTTSSHRPATPAEPPVSSFPEVIERDIKLDDEPAESMDVSVVPSTKPVTQPTPPNTSTPAATPVDDYNYLEELDTLHAMVNNYETVAKALILIIELIQSNPLIINKIIIPSEPAFIELVQILTGADEVEIRYSEDVGCTISKKYRYVEDIIVIKNTEPKSLRYSHPDIIRLFDKFNISVKMIATSK